MRATLAACAVEHPPRLSPGEAPQSVFRRVLEQTEHALLNAPTTSAKSLLLMRALGTKSELFADARNPLLPGGPSEGGAVDPERSRAVDASGRSRAISGGAVDLEQLGGDAPDAAPALGRLEAFPLPWRPLHAVAGCAEVLAPPRAHAESRAATVNENV